MEQSNTQKKPAKPHSFPVVGIGASAGSIEPLKILLRAVSKNSGMAYVIVQHLNPDYDSRLMEILEKETELPVFEIVNGINLVPDTIYIIPENNNLIAEDGLLMLEPRNRGTRRNMVIDVFFESLAEVHKAFAVGVLLSGSAYDGTQGLKKIKEMGGATVVQDPETALFKGMPQSAIDADAADYIVHPVKIPAQLEQIHKTYEVNHGYSDEEHLTGADEEITMQIVKLIFAHTGNDFRHYKQPTIRRRIARRMVIVKKNTLEDYFNFLRNNKDEQELLFNDFLIPVTYFFRDGKTFEVLQEVVFPKLIENATNKNLRIWIAGCSTGEEAYSIAISLHEYITTTVKEDIRVQIFASDVSERSIAKARSAIYSQQDVQNVSEARLNNYFVKRDGGYHISKTIRDMCVFATHNFIKDPSFARIDLVSCRNVLIYFDPYLQNKVFGTFHYALKDKGILFLGKSETAAGVPNLFEQANKHDKIYIKKFTAERYVPETVRPMISPVGRISHLPEKKNALDADFRKAASDLLFNHYTPAGVVVNEHLDIVHFHGDTGPFLLQSPGKPNFNILKMAREGLAFELRNALHDAKKSEESVKKENIKIKGQPYMASVEILPLNKADHLSLVVFKKIPIPEVDPNKNDKKTADKARISDLEKELAQLREDIKRVTEEQQTAYEELQTTNEELLSSSEELQALNEELETSTEEMQSNNEELLCVNDELMDRQEQLISMRNYSESILRTIREPILVIDKDFVIKSANPSFYRYFNTTEHETEGFSIFEIGRGQWDVPEFKDLLKKVLPEKTNIDDYTLETFVPGVGKKMMVMNARKILDAKPAELILVAIEDVTKFAQVNAQLSAINKELEAYNEHLQTFSSAASHDLQEPLRKIHMFCNLIIENEPNLSDSSRHHMNRMMLSVGNMRQLINDLIDYTRANIAVKDFKKTDMNLLMKKTLDELKESIESSHATVEIPVFPQMQTIPGQMQQLFSNLILNAIKYSREDVRPEIIIETEIPAKKEIDALEGDPDLEYIKIKITDNGIGFSHEHADKIFEPFYRLHSKDSYGGSGLGLSLCKKIVSNHKGFIRASSKINAGTTISIYLPLM